MGGVPAARKGGMGVGGVAIIVVSVLVLCGLGGTAVSSMILTAKEPAPLPDALVEQMCADPSSELCPEDAAAEPVGLTLAVEEFPAGPDLAAGYVRGFLELLRTDEPGPRVREINDDAMAANRIADLSAKVRECGARADLDIRITDTKVVEANDKHAQLKVRVIETAPACVTDTKAPPGALVRGTTDLELNFIPKPGPGARPIYLLTDIDADPVTPDPLAAQPPRKGDPLTRTDYKGLFTTI